MEDFAVFPHVGWGSLNIIVFSYGLDCSFFKGDRGLGLDE